MRRMLWKWRVSWPCSAQQERRAHHLHERVGACERQPVATVTERMRYRRGQAEAREHEHEHHHAHGRLVGVYPVGEPAGVHPHPPHREQQERDFERAGGVAMLEQRVRELRDREYEHEIEEQLDVGDARVRAARSQEVGQRFHGANGGGSMESKQESSDAPANHSCLHVRSIRAAVCQNRLTSRCRARG
jgi:hypothetical protein